MAIKQIKLPNGTVHDIATTISNVEGLETALSEKAPKASAALTGTPTAPTAAAGTKTTQIATTAFVNTEINNKIAAADAMIYKGTIGSSGATITALPASHKTGYTYKVITAGTYAGVKCEIGDMIICLTDGTSANDAHWTVVQNNIDGAVIGPTSAVSGNVALFDGTTGKLIKDSGFTIGKSVPSDAKFTDTTYTFNGAVSTIKDSNLTASRALIANSSGKVAVSAVTSTELGYLDGVTSAIQTQLDGKVPTSRTINGKALSSNISLTASDVGALPNTTTIPTVNNATLTIQKNGTSVATFTANSSTNVTANITVPTGAAANKGVDTSISAASTSTNLPTSKAVAAFVEGKGYKTTDNNTTYTFATGDSNGQIKVTPSGGSAQNVSVKGLGSAAYTASTAYATAAQGTKADNALPKAGGNISGHIYLTGANASSSTGSTSQIVFGTSSNNHVVISSNDNALVINPTTTTTTNQIVLYLDKASQFPSGISANVTGNLTGNASSASKVNNKLTIKLNGGSTEGTNLFTFDGSAAKTLNITASSIGAAPAYTYQSTDPGAGSSLAAGKLLFVYS